MQSTDCTDDFSLIREAQRGDHAAFEKLVYAYGHGILRLALRITGSQVDAQDIYQETFLKAFKKIAGFRYECAFSTWIYRIATNVCLDHLRKKRTRKETCATELNADCEKCDLLNQVSDDRTPSNPEQQVLGRELGAHISRALTRLTPRERIVFELKHYQGLTLRTLSGILNCSEATIKTTLFRATRKLRLALAGFLSGEELCGETRSGARGVNQIGERMEKGETSEEREERMAATSLAPTLNTTITEQRPFSEQRILVMAENRALQRTLQRLFSSQGYEVEIVADDLVGLEMLRKRPPSALILDLKYSASLGWKLCHEIAQSAPDIPFVILSANSDVMDKILLLEIGADDCMLQPFQPRELVARLRSLIRRATPASRKLIYVFENVVVDFVRMEVTRDGEAYHSQQRNSRRWSS